MIHFLLKYCVWYIEYMKFLKNVCVDGSVIFTWMFRYFFSSCGYTPNILVFKVNFSVNMVIDFLHTCKRKYLVFFMGL